jgi:hypothetical protein
MGCYRVPGNSSGRSPFAWRPLELPRRRSEANPKESKNSTPQLPLRIQSSLIADARKVQANLGHTDLWWDRGEADSSAALRNDKWECAGLCARDERRQTTKYRGPSLRSGSRHVGCITTSATTVVRPLRRSGWRRFWEGCGSAVRAGRECPLIAESRPPSASSGQAVRQAQGRLWGTRFWGGCEIWATAIGSSPGG